MLSWLDAGPSGGGAYPPINVFRKGDDFLIGTCSSPVLVGARREASTKRLT